MSGKPHILLLLIIGAISGPVLPQDRAGLSQQTEDLLFRDESADVPIELLESEAEMLDHPLDLNNATQDQLGMSGLFTPFQIHMIIRYREEFGELYSIYELTGLTGFNESRIRSIEAYLTVITGTTPHPAKGSHHLILINAGKTMPEARGYNLNSNVLESPVYNGSPVKTSLRIKTDIGKFFSAGLSYEKDAGERFLHGRRPEFISGYLSYTRYRLIKQLVVGKFQLHHGLGLVNGIGFFHSPERYQLRRLSLIKLQPYSSLNEYNFEQGIACRMALKEIGVLLWASYQTLDLSLSGIQQDPGDTDSLGVNDVLAHIRKTGMHRSRNELNGRNLGYSFHTGIQTIVQQNNLTTGLMCGIEKNGLTRAGIDSMGYSEEPALRGIFSVHAMWHLDGLELFGEVAAVKMDSKAILIGSRYNFSDFFQGLLMLHNYDPGYTGLRPTSYASGNNISNENGFSIGFHMEPGTLFTADFLAEIFSFPFPRYLTDAPSVGYKYSCIIKNTGINQFQWKFRISKKFFQTTPGSEISGLREIRSSTVSRFEYGFTYLPQPNLKWQSRLLVSFLQTERKPSPGHAATQQLTFGFRKILKCTLQFVVFNVRDWNNRIYIYEPGLYYSFNFPVYYGIGQKLTSVVSLKPLKWMTLTGKASLITYYDRKETGSGNDLIPGNEKMELEIQLRLNL